MVPKHSLSCCLVSPFKSVFLERPALLAGEHVTTVLPLLTRAAHRDGAPLTHFSAYLGGCLTPFLPSLALVKQVFN